jgi:hypothetical protein
MQRGLIYLKRGFKGDLTTAKDLLFQAWERDPDDYNRTLNQYKVNRKLRNHDEAAVWYAALIARPEHKDLVVEAKSTKVGQKSPTQILEPSAIA